MDIPVTFPVKKGPTSFRAEQIQSILDLMGEDSSRFMYWLGRTKHLSPDRIYAFLQTAKTFKNPQAGLNYLLKAHK